MREVFQANFGGRLKAAREARNLAQSDVAAKLKLTARQIEALEQEDFSHLPSEVFVRGFVRNYARLVGIEPDSLIAPVDAQAEVSETITAPNAGLVVGSNGIRIWLVYPIVALTIFLLLVAALYYWLRQGEDALITTPPAAISQSDPATTGEDLIAPTITPLPDAAAPTLDVNQLAGQPSALPMPDSGQTSNAGIPVAPEAAARTPPSAQPMPTPPEAISPAANANAGASANTNADAKMVVRSMRFEPATDAWIQVVDAKGARFSKLVIAGTKETFSGMPPFRLVVGEAALVKLTYNGHSIDLAPFIGQKVARLTLE
jgi:cytoskeleton protein RodZ